MIECLHFKTIIGTNYAQYRHDMETLSALLALCEGNQAGTGGLTEGQWCGADGTVEMPLIWDTRFSCDSGVMKTGRGKFKTLEWRHNERDCVSNHRRHNYSAPDIGRNKILF